MEVVTMKKFKKFSKKFILSLIFLFAILWSIYLRTFSSYFFVIVDGDSMYPTFYNHEILFFTKKIDELQLNDVVVFEYNGETFIKRITGKNGDTYCASTAPSLGYLLVHRDYSKVPKNEYYTFKKIKQDEFYVQGDNKGLTFDSDCFGPIKKSQIFGKLFKMYN